MDMWNWLMECYKDGCLSLEECEKVMRDDKSAADLWREFSSDPRDFIHDIRHEVGAFIQYLKKEKGQ